MVVLHLFSICISFNLSSVHLSSPVVTVLRRGRAIKSCRTKELQRGKGISKKLKRYCWERSPCSQSKLWCLRLRKMVWNLDVLIRICVDVYTNALISILSWHPLGIRSSFRNKNMQISKNSKLYGRLRTWALVYCVVMELLFLREKQGAVSPPPPSMQQIPQWPKN